MRALALLLLLSGCTSIRYHCTWQWEGIDRPYCADEVLTLTRVLAPCSEGKPKHGSVYWYPVGPFKCDGRLVAGCAETATPYVRAWVSWPSSGHAADSAMAEEIGHWVFAHCGKNNYDHEPEFVAWVNLVNSEARKVCK